MKLRTLTVSELNGYIKAIFNAEELLNDLWVKGEISNLREYQAGSQIYFTLKDQNSQISCVIFNNFLKIPFKIKDNQQVVLKGKLAVYEKKGTYSIQVNYLEPLGKGSLAVAFEQLKQKLAEEGLFDADKKKKISDKPSRIAILASPDGAALTDVIATIRARDKAMDITIFPTIVQGKDCASSVQKNIDLANTINKYDLIIITRGGGSLEELWGFNEEKTVRAIAASRLPIISAVGHEIDFTLADLVADLRAATPTAAAIQITQKNQEFKTNLQYYKSTLINKYSQYLLNKKEKLPYYQMLLNEKTKAIISQNQTKILKLKNQLHLANPLLALDAGFALITKNGYPIKSYSQLTTTNMIEIIFKDGTKKAQII